MNHTPEQTDSEVTRLRDELEHTQISLRYEKLITASLVRRINNPKTEIGKLRRKCFDWISDFRELRTLAKQLDEEASEKTNEVARLRELLEKAKHLLWIALPHIDPKAIDAEFAHTKPISECYINTMVREELAALALAPKEPETSAHPDKCIGNVTLDLKRLYQSMPKHLQKKVSLHDLKLICDAYNGDQPPVDNQYVADGCEKFGHWPEENKCTCGAESWENFSHFHDGICILAPAPEEPVSEGTRIAAEARSACNDLTEAERENALEKANEVMGWRGLGPDEVIQGGDEASFIGNFWKAVTDQKGKPVNYFTERIRFRTRRPLPKPKLTRES